MTDLKTQIAITITATRALLNKHFGNECAKQGRSCRVCECATATGGLKSIEFFFIGFRFFFFYFVRTGTQSKLL